MVNAILSELCVEIIMSSLPLSLPTICLTIAVNFYGIDLDMIMAVDMSVRWVAGLGLLMKGLMVVLLDVQLAAILQVNAVYFSYQILLVICLLSSSGFIFSIGPFEGRKLHIRIM